MKDIVQPPDHNLGLSAELKSVIFLQYYSFAYNLLYTPMLNYSRKSNAHIICCTMFTYLTSLWFFCEDGTTVKWTHCLPRLLEVVLVEETK